MPLPLLIPLAIGFFTGAGTAKKEGKEQFKAVRGRAKKDGSTSDPVERRLLVSATAVGAFVLERV